MRPVAALFVLFWLALGAAAAPPSAPDIDPVFHAWQGKVPGGAVGVVLKDKLVYSKGYGMANLAKGIPNTPQTLYDLASVSKQFCATAVLLQAQKGKLSLKAGLGTYLPGLPDYAAKTPVENLLNMTSGFPDYDFDGAVDRKTLIATLNEGEPSFRAGSRYEYLNMNYALLTYVVQKVASQSMGQVLEYGIFRPLKMSHTVFLSKADQVIADRAVGYAKNGSGWSKSVSDSPGVADGNVFSSVEDLSLWARDLLRGSSLLTPESLKKAWTSGRAGGEETGYGFGFEIDEHEGYRRISHTGSWYGTATYVALYPQLKLGVIVLSNREDEDVYSLGEQVEDLYLNSARP